MFLRRLLIKINSILFRLSYKYFFGEFGKNTSLVRPLLIQGMKNIYLGNYVYISFYSKISSVPLTGNGDSVLKIDNGTKIGSFSHIFATKRIEIGKKVLIADKVYISDNLHSFTDIKVPIMEQPIKQIRQVCIGDGTWLGENVCVIGASIGRNCVIGANSVVTKDIPDYSIAVGSPARVIKKYDVKNKKWVKI